MDSIKDKLLAWVNEAEEFNLPRWNELPDIDLYMDQVITYLEKQLYILTKPNEEKPITSSMINNYVKNEIIPRPTQKKYTREHMAHLISVLNLKNILSLVEIAELISNEISDKPIDLLYNQLIQIQGLAIKDTAKRVKEALSILDPENEDCNEETLSLLALRFSLEANANRVVAKKILEKLAEKKKQEKDISKNSSKNKG